jgi:uncharacterized DUF497 family protein
LRYQFDWDPEKEIRNIHKHQVSFHRAASVFLDPNQLSVYDDQHSNEEDRWVTIGIDTSGVVSVVIHTFKQIEENLCEIRIISARKSTTTEMNQYLEGIST